MQPHAGYPYPARTGTDLATLEADNADPAGDQADEPLLRVPTRVIDEAIRSLGIYFERINGIDRGVLGRDHVNPARYLRNVEALNKEIPLAGKKLLEIGSGFGVSLALMLKRFEVDGYGIEPASEGFGTSNICAREIFEANQLDPARIVDAVGEAIPFPDATFDVVYSNNVLEHTSNPAAVLREAVRVLKPGGRLFIEVPNYLAFYEGHYLVPQPPIFWNGMLAFWVRTFFGRDPSFARTLRTEINPVWLRKTFRTINQRYAIELETLGEDRFLQRMGEPFSFQTVAVAGVAGRAIRIVQKLNWRNWIGLTLVRLQAHYPIVLVATRGK
jgi:SAM-dependent methyltransferase